MEPEKKEQDESEDLSKKLNKFKPKKKITVSADLLDGAKSYDDKVIVVKAVTEKEMKRVVLLVKKMLRDGVESKKKI
jgi:biopolymer transport protein ExbD